MKVAPAASAFRKSPSCSAAAMTGLRSCGPADPSRGSSGSRVPTPARALLPAGSRLRDAPAVASAAWICRTKSDGAGASGPFGRPHPNPNRPPLLFCFCAPPSDAPFRAGIVSTCGDAPSVSERRCFSTVV